MDLLNPEDAFALIERAQRGDTAAFGTLYEHYFTPVYRYVYFRTKNAEDAEDLVQTVFLKAFQSLHRYASQGKNPLAFFYTVARNTLIDHWRKKRDIVLDDPGAVTVKADALQQREHFQNTFDESGNAEIVRKALLYLPEEQQEVVVLKYINDLSNREIAEKTGKSEQAVRQMQCRALKKLRTSMTTNETA